MEEKNAFDILVDNLNTLGLEPNTNRNLRRFLLSGNDRLLSTKYVLATFDSMFLIASDSYGTRVGSSSTFTGLYSSIDLPEIFECKIYKKDWIDFFILFKKRRSGVQYIDENVTITSSSKSIPHNLLSMENVIAFLEMNKTMPFSLLIQNNYQPMIRALKDKKVIGLEIKDWVYQKPDIEKLINTGGKLLKDITTRLNKTK